jgi:hypothetical protein
MTAAGRQDVAIADLSDCGNFRPKALLIAALVALQRRHLRPRLSDTDRLFTAGSAVGRHPLLIVKPEAVLDWQRAGCLIGRNLSEIHVWTAPAVQEQN